jgi:tetratricopeptide (TPR) repeat protein
MGILIIYSKEKYLDKVFGICYNQHKRINMSSDSKKAVVGEVKRGEQFRLSTSRFFKKIKNKIPKRGQRFMLPGTILVICILITGLALIYFNKTNTATKTATEAAMANENFKNHNNSQALEHAKKALALAPDDPDAILLAANLSLPDHPAEAKALFAHALDIFKQQDNPDVDGKKAVTYWAAAGLAEKAGQTEQAKKYYQKVIDSANPKDPYEQSLLKQAQAARMRLL